MALDGIMFEGVSVRVRRPNDYNPAAAAALGPSVPNPALNLAAIGLSSGGMGAQVRPYCLQGFVCHLIVDLLLGNEHCWRIALGRKLIAAPLGPSFLVDYPPPGQNLALHVQGKVVTYIRPSLFSYCCFEAAFLMVLSLLKAHSVTLQATHNSFRLTYAF